ncbi:Putative methyltransferase family protein [Striga hermonthica]|uniref:Methyltransferase family protein n=1 Tax=Striga hermonthica TaxID=68872 RepID=A0A9N7P4B5_STRHE|nr:Putative methyltransferase family protein [Striga hermonthica]
MKGRRRKEKWLLLLEELLDPSGFPHGGVGVNGSLIRGVRELIARDWEVRLLHDWRESNFAADSLASLATRSPAGLHVLQHPPDDVNPWLEHNIIAVGISCRFQLICAGPVPYSTSMASRNNKKEIKSNLKPQYDQHDDNEYTEALFPQSSSVEKSDQISTEHGMTTSSHHYFGSTEDGFSIRIIQNMKEEYGLFVWPSSIILAEYVWQQKSRFAGANVVELGAGTSLPGLVAAKVGADVTLTDDSSRSEVMDNMRKLCNINNLKCRVLGLTWGLWDEPVFNLRPNIILGADVLYDSSAFDELFATVTFLLQRCPDSVFITTYHNRSGHHLIEFLMEKWCLKCTKLVDGYSLMPSHKASTLSGNIQLAEIVLDTNGSQRAKCKSTVMKSD